MRTDAALIKYMAQMSLEAAALYNRLPLFLMPEELIDLLQNMDNILATAPDTLTYPFDDFIIDFPYGTSAVNRVFDCEILNHGRLWVSIRPVTTVRLGDPVTGINQDGIDELSKSPPAIFLEGWEEKNHYNHGFSFAPESSIVGIERGYFDDHNTFSHSLQNPLCEEFQSLGNIPVWCDFDKCPYQPGTDVYENCVVALRVHVTMCRLVVLAIIYLSENLGGTTTQISWTPAP